MKGIILAGGTGSRLMPTTRAISKQLIPVYDKPMIFYPISSLFLAGIREIAIISKSEDLLAYKSLLGDGRELGAKFTFLIQDYPKGIAEAFLIAEKFIGSSNVSLILGDNIFHGFGFGRNLAKFTSETKATILAYQVSNPEDFGVVELNNEGKALKLVEKPKKFISQMAVPGFYFYGNDVIERARKIEPSPRGELEITSINQDYLATGDLKVEKIPRGVSWFDGGTIESIHDASEYVRVVQKRQGLKIGCIEEIAWRNGWISANDLFELGKKLRGTEYGEYLMELGRGNIE
jgi:glucose-1-phosphate thymidylyltransferase